MNSSDFYAFTIFFKKIPPLKFSIGLEYVIGHQRVWEEIVIIGVKLETPCGRLVGDPQIIVGDPLIFIGDPHIFIGYAQIFIGDPMILVRDPHIFIGDP